MMRKAVSAGGAPRALEEVGGWGAGGQVGLVGAEETGPCSPDPQTCLTLLNMEHR
jgi:hypothetical protein